MTSYHECKCGCEIEMDVDICERMVEVPEECPECNYKFSPLEQDYIYSKALTDGWSSAIDYATNRNR